MRSLFASLGLSFALILASADTHAAPPPLDVTTEPSALRAVGFSNLVLRLDTNDEIGLAGEDFRTYILEALRAKGFNAVGAESLVFGKDASKRAELLLGGTVREFECLDRNGWLNCRIGIEWQLLDLARDTVVYSVLSRHRELGIQRPNTKVSARKLVLGALGSLMARPGFASVLRDKPNVVRDVPNYTKATTKRCPATGMTMPASAEEALRATVLVQSSHGFGSGFFLSPDGLVLTAAHVVTTSDLSVRMRDGTVHPAVPIRIARNVDTALLRLAEVGTAATPCLPLNLEAKTVGTEVYAIGSPASEKLAFSLTRGIVSGVRNFDGTQFLQTDASISPGNSGGPLIDARGRAVAIVSWKVAGATVEGVAFGIPVEQGLAGLAVTPGNDTDAAIARAEVIELKTNPTTKSEPDSPDPRPGLDPQAEREEKAAQERAEDQEKERRRRAEQALRERLRAEKLARLTPSYVPILRYGGLAVAGAGALGVYYSYSQYDERSTSQPDFRALRLMNDLSWVTIGLGTAAFAASFILMPTLPKDVAAKPDRRPRLAVGGGPSTFRVDLRVDL